MGRWLLWLPLSPAYTVFFRPECWLSWRLGKVPWRAFAPPPWRAEKRIRQAWIMSKVGVMKGNEDAKALYEKAGFVVDTVASEDDG